MIVLPKTTQSPLPPANPEAGDFWINEATMVRFVWYVMDNGQSQWVQSDVPMSTGVTAYFPGFIGPIGPSTTITNPTPRITLGPNPPGSPAEGDLWWSTITGQQSVWYNDGNSYQWVISNFGGKAGPKGEPGIIGEIDVGPGLTGGGSQLVVSIGIDNTIVALKNDLTPLAPIASPVFTGDPRAPTPAVGDADTSIATTAFVRSAIIAIPPVDLSGYAPLASPAFTGTPTAPTVFTGSNTNQQLANAASVVNYTAAFYAPISSPTFTGDPKAPTPTAGDNDTSIATTAFVAAAISALAPGGVTSFNTRTGAITLTAGDVTGVGGALLASPTFTGDPKAPTPTAGDNDTSIATTAFVTTALGPYATTASLSAYAPLASPLFTGDPRAPTPATADNDTSIATTAFVRAAISTYSPPPDLSGYAPLASPLFTGDPRAPTPATSDNDTSIATTAFVKAAISAGGASLYVGDTAPGSPTVNMLWWKSDIGQMFLYYQDPNTTQWVPASPAVTQTTQTPPGTIVDFAGAAAPSGWYLCSGQAVSRTADAGLFAAIGTAYGSGDGSTTFNLPDCRGRVTAMIDGGTGRLAGYTTVGAAGGEQNHVLTLAELAAHQHGPGNLGGVTAVGNNLANGTNRAVGTGDGVNFGYFADTVVNRGTTDAQGSNAGHNTVQPTIAFNKIIKR